MKKENGITLIALVITIIVMLILVGVSVTVALNGGLFSTAQKATGDTKAERDNELALSDGKVTINGEEYNSIDEYVNGSGNGAGGQKVEITPKKETYTIGEEVTIGEENFYVIADDAQKVTLLAKYNLNKEGITQSNAAYSETGCAFSSTNYWSTIEGITYPYDLNDTATSSDTDAIAKARVYGAAKGGTGRLMTYSEAEALQSANTSDILYGRNGKSSSSYLMYWLGSADFTVSVWSVHGGRGDLTSYGFDYDSCGVRPVVEISKSSIS